MSRSKNKIVGITMGDPGGIGPEVIAHTLMKSSVRRLARFVVIGDRAVYSRYFRPETSHCAFFDVTNLKAKDLPRRPDKNTARASLKYIDCAIELLKRGEITSLVTGPVCKEAILSLGVRFEGHTEYLARAFKVKDFGMMFVTEGLKTILVTRHIPLSGVSRLITAQRVYHTISLANTTLKKHFRRSVPRIAVCGLNPHAGEGGNIGKEEIKKIIPAIRHARRNHIHADGPFAADTLFSPDIAKHYDAVVAMYHDQGLIPVKTLHFKDLVNFTTGLPFIRTSPAHGTAFDIAGKNKADPSSMRAAIELAARLS